MSGSHRPIAEPVVILANGPYPTHPVPLQYLAEAGTIICTDGSVDKLRTHGRTPHIVIGDMDSTGLQEQTVPAQWVRITDPSHTDLEKTVIWGRDNGIRKAAILAATGEREDHTLANLLLLARYSDKIQLELVTDHAIIECLEGEKTYPTFPGQTVSLLPVTPLEAVTTEGLVYILRNEPLAPSSRGVSNVSRGERFTVKSSGKLWVFRFHKT
jgi:thiamine pyrophosphokinase